MSWTSEEPPETNFIRNYCLNHLVLDDVIGILFSSTKVTNNLSAAYEQHCTFSLQDQNVISKNTFRNISCKTENFKNAFYSFWISEWIKLEAEIKKSDNLRSSFNIHDPLAITLVTRLRLDFSQLNEFKFRHNIRDTMSPMYDCGTEIESTEHFLFERNHLFKSLHYIKPPILNIEKNILTNVLLLNQKSMK